MTKRRTTEDTVSKIVKVITPILGALADDLEKENERLREWQATLLEATGTSRPDHALSVVQTTANRLAEREADIQELCEAAGVSHKGNLLQKLRSELKASSALPEVFRYHPPHWVKEAKTVKEYDDVRYKYVTRTEKGVTAPQAQRKLDRLAPVIAAVLKESEQASNPDAFLAEMVGCFNTETYDEFADLCYKYLRNDPEDQQEESVVEEVVEGTNNKLEQQLEEMRLAAAETGEDFDEDATRCLLLSEA
jgi:hypothetical protein